MVASKQTRLKLRKGFTNAPISYRVLVVHQFNDKDKKVIAKGLIQATTPDKAAKLLPTPGNPTPWTMFAPMALLDGQQTRLKILRFKGADVALYYKRMVSNVIPDLEDPVPEGALDDEEDVWVRLDLFSKSVRQLVGHVDEAFTSLGAKVAELEFELSATQQLLEAAQHENKSLRGQITASQKKKSPRKR